jgi:hypothetical protein
MYDTKDMTKAKKNPMPTTTPYPAPWGRMGATSVAIFAVTKLVVYEGHWYELRKPFSHADRLDHSSWSENTATIYILLEP